MKHVAPMGWEAWWLVYSFVVAGAVSRWRGALLTVPSLGRMLGDGPGATLWRRACFSAGGVGIGGIMFGISITYVGVGDYLWSRDRLVRGGGGNGAPAAKARRSGVESRVSLHCPGHCW